MTGNPTPDSSLRADGLDRKQLRLLRERFKALNSERLGRARSLLPLVARQFLDALPLLYHLNHPALPGYAGNDLPAGISGFVPGREHLDAAARIGRGFNGNSLPLERGDIHGLFTMGSLGSLAQSRDSDFDIWLCAPQPVLSALAPKTAAISAWAANRGLAVTIFAVDPEQYRQGERLQEQLAGEDCGSTQHQLLLDEFYRSHLLLAGRYPVWWLVPHSKDADYDEFVSLIRERRYLPADETLDLGNVAELPEEEFLGATLWQLSKALDAPEKSLLKLMLIELHATGQVAPISAQLKTLLHQDQVTADQADPYLLMYQAIATHLGHDPARLELARRCLITRATAPVGVRRDWRRQLVLALAEDWHWPRSAVGTGASSRLGLAELGREQRELQRQLERSHQLLRQLTARSDLDQRVSADDLQLLEARLRAQLERRAGKLDRLPPGLRRRLRTEPLVLRELTTAESSSWQLATMAAQDIEVYQADALVTVLTWLLVNTLLDPGTPLQVMATDEPAVRRTLQRLHDSLGLHRLREPESAAFMAPAKADRTLLLINPGIDPNTTGGQSPQPSAMVSAREDSLRFSGFHQNLVRTASAVHVNTWGEVSSSHASGDDALPEMLCQLLDWHQGPTATGSGDVQATSPGRSELAAGRVRELYQDLQTALLEDAGRVYVFELANDFVAIWHDGQRHCWQRDNNRTRLLASTTRGRGLQVDHRATRMAQTARLLPLLPDTAAALLVDTLDRNGGTLLRDLDGSIVEYSWPRRPARELIQSLQVFLLNVAPRAGLSDSQRPGLWLCRQDLAVPARDLDLRLPFPVQAMRCPDAGHGASPHWDLICDGRTFAGLAMTPSGMQPFTNHLLAQRRSGGRYPVHVTDIDLHLPAPPGRIAPFLNAKRELERILAESLASGGRDHPGTS